MKKRQLFVIAVIALGVVHFAGFFDAKKDGSAPAGSSSQAPAMPFGQMMNALSQNMTLWNSLDYDSKVQAINAVVTLYKNRDNAAITQPADFYVKKFDEALMGNPSLMGMDIMTMTKIMAVMESDFYNGQNKDELAKAVLGEKIAEAMKLRRQVGQG